MLKLKMHWQILIALFVAVFVGLLFPEQVKYVSWIGDVFLRGLKMIIIPLIFTSIVSGMLGIGTGKSLGRLGLKTILYYLSTSLLAIVTGLVLVNMVQPGLGIELGATSTIEVDMGTKLSLTESWIAFRKR